MAKSSNATLEQVIEVINTVSGLSDQRKAELMTRASLNANGSRQKIFCLAQTAITLQEEHYKIRLALDLKWKEFQKAREKLTQFQ